MTANRGDYLRVTACPSCGQRSAIPTVAGHFCPTASGFVRFVPVETTVGERYQRDGLSGATTTLRAWLDGEDVEGPALCAELAFWLDYWGGWCPPDNPRSDVPDRAPIPGDCDACDGWHPDGECPVDSGSSSAPSSVSGAVEDQQ